MKMDMIFQSIEIEVADDSMDVLLFDENSISPYENGQSYHSYFEEEASFESALGSIDFDWKPPQSSSEKRWYYVIDNRNFFRRGLGK